MVSALATHSASIVPPPGLEGVLLQGKGKHVSPSKLRRDRTRVSAHKHYLTNHRAEARSTHYRKESAAVCLLAAWADFFRHSDNVLARSARGEHANASQPAARNRDIFPLPSIDIHFSKLDRPLEENECKMVNICLAALNVLNRAGTYSPFASSKATSAQIRVQLHVIHRCRRLLERLQHIEADMQDFAGSLRMFGAHTAEYPLMDASLVDLPLKAATCEPNGLISESLRDHLARLPEVLPTHRIGLRNARISSRDREAYIELVAREILIGKLHLRKDVQGVGSYFVVGKKDGSRQRAVWNGSAICKATGRPPCPRKLGNPGALMDLVVREGETLFWSKRDATSFFDQLIAPSVVQPWLARPAVHAGVLAEALHIDLKALERFCPDVADGRDLASNDLLFPCSSVWPMGHSWSSAIAQDVTIGLLRESGLAENYVFSETTQPAVDQREVAFVLTDDTILAHKSLEDGRERLNKLDATFQRFNVAQRFDKNVDLSDSLVGMGCLLSSRPPRAEPEIVKLWSALKAILNLHSHHIKEISAACVGGLAGVCQWFCLLSRNHFSIFHSLYAFVRQEPLDVQRPLPLAVANELFLFGALSPLLGADLDRPINERVFATDASPSFGLGISVCAASQDVIEQLNCYAEKRDDFIELNCEDNSHFKPRQGIARKLGLKKDDFRDCLSVRTPSSEHAGTLEAKAVLLLMRWALRSLSNHSKRWIVLIDAKVVLHMVAKGRTSAPTLRRCMSSIAAHALAGNILLRPLYVPSEYNPADGPSRGHRRRPSVRRRALKQNRPQKMSRLEAHLDNMTRAYERLKETGMISSYSASLTSTSSPYDS